MEKSSYCGKMIKGLVQGFNFNLQTVNNYLNAVSYLLFK